MKCIGTGLVLLTFFLLVGCGESRDPIVGGIDQYTLDLMLEILWDFSEPDSFSWEDSGWDDATVIEGLELIYWDAMAQEDWDLRERVIFAMGESTLVVFELTLLSAMEDEAWHVCNALGKIPSEAGVYALTNKLNDEYVSVRVAAVRSLGKFPYYADFPAALQAALDALSARQQVEQDELVLYEIQVAIEALEPQLG